MRPDSSSRFGVGLWLALLSAFAFATSGTLAAGLLATGWSPLGIVIPRVSIGAAVTLGFALVALRGRWSVLRQHWQMVVSYGVVAIAVPQLAHFSAVQYMQVAQGLLIQYLAPVAIVFWLWLRRGERPAPRTVLGSVVAMGGLALVLQVSAAGFSLDLRGVAWSLLAMLGNAAYFIFSSDDRTDLPPVVMVAGGTVCASVLLIAVALVGLLPVAISTAPVTYAGFEVAWWVPLVVLGVVASAASYLLGITGARLLGTRLASFVGLSEVLIAIILASVLVGQVLTGSQWLGGLLVLAGVVLVKLGEGRTGRRPTAAWTRPVTEQLPEDGRLVEGAADPIR